MPCLLPGELGPFGNTVRDGTGDQIQAAGLDNRREVEGREGIMREEKGRNDMGREGKGEGVGGEKGEGGGKE